MDKPKGPTKGSPSCAGDVVAASQLVAEAVAQCVQHDATHTAQGLGRQELHLGHGDGGWRMGM